MAQNDTEEYYRFRKGRHVVGGKIEKKPPEKKKKRFQTNQQIEIDISSEVPLSLSTEYLISTLKERKKFSFRTV